MSTRSPFSAHSDYIRNHFDSGPEELSSLARGYRRLLAHYYALLIPPTASVLEIGCGTGELLRHLPAREKVGLDISEQQIERARKRVPDAEFIHGDVKTIQESRKFDYVIISETLNFVTDVQRLLSDAHRVATPETRLLINIPNTLWKPAFGLADLLGLRTSHPASSWLSLNDVQNLLALAEWTTIKTQARAVIPVPGGWPGRLLNRWLAPLLPSFCLALFVVARATRPTTAKHAPTVSVVVPARNEAGNIEAAITRTPTMGEWTEFIFVEGGSRDNTWEEIQRVQKAYPDRRIKILQQSEIGKGNAVREGFAQAEGDILMILDADLTMPPEELPKYVNALIAGHCEFANGCRLVYPMEDKAMQFLNMIANKTFGLLFSWMLGQDLKDTLCGTKVLRRTAYERIAANRAYFGEFDPFGDFDLLFGADKLNLQIRDIPIRYRDRTYGATNINRWRHGWLLLRMVLFAARKLKFV